VTSTARPREDDTDTEALALILHRPRLVPMGAEQHREAVRLLATLIDSWATRQRCTAGPVGGQSSSGRTTHERSA
jgi:hypothetical protein